MLDLQLDFKNSKLLNKYIDGKDRVVQQIKVACRSWIGDFFLNEDFGVDYDNSWGNSQLMELYIRQQIEAIPGVFSITKTNITKSYDEKDRVIFILDVELIYDKEVISISETITER